jgi:DNA-binding transcriptional LysR family regulator
MLALSLPILFNPDRLRYPCGGRIAVAPADLDIENSESPVQGLNTGSLHSLPEAARWDDLRVAIALHEAGSFRQSAEALHVTINTVRARLDRLEASVGQRLFRRSPQGVVATPAGLELIGAALRMRRNASTGAMEGQSRLVASDELRIGTSDALGTLWLTPRLGALQDQLSGLTVNLQCRYDLKSERGEEVDIELGFHRSTDPRMISARVATLHFMLFASRSYIERHGVPQGLSDLADHRFIEQVSPGVNSRILDFLVGTDQGSRFIPIRTNSSMTLLWSVLNGEGIAAMPTYVMAFGDSLVPLDLPVQLRFDIFLTYHPDLRDAAPAVIAIRWLKRIFAPAQQPWFREHFVHPAEMVAASSAGVGFPLPMLAGAFDAGLGGAIR